MTPASARGEREMEVEVEGRKVRLTNLDKVLYPQVGFTKGDVIEYYRRVAPVLLPHLRGRALTLKRYPDGVEGVFFYEKSCPPHRPGWVRTEPVWSKVRGDDIDFCVVDDVPSLLWAANLADLELHVSLAMARRPHAPTALVFDLDPGPGTDIVDCGRIALRLRDVLDDMGLRSVAKASGSKGMQLYAPLNTQCTFDDTKPLARALGEMVEAEDPGRVTTNMKKAERKGRVLIDWSQNDDHKTTVCAYSLRAKDEPTVSTPLAWMEVETLVREGDPALARFLPEEVVRRIEEHGDLFAPVLRLEQPLPVMT